MVSSAIITYIQNIHNSAGAISGINGGVMGTGSVVGGSYSTQVSTVIVGNAYYCSNFNLNLKNIF